MAIFDFGKSLPSFEKSIDPDQLASDELFYLHDKSILIMK